MASLDEAEAVLGELPQRIHDGINGVHVDRSIERERRNPRFEVGERERNEVETDREKGEFFYRYCSTKRQNYSKPPSPMDYFENDPSFFLAQFHMYP